MTLPSRCLIVVLAAVAPLAAQRPDPSDAVIRGRVTASGEGLPVRRARVECASPVLKAPRVVLTDDAGRFECRGPAGRYVVTVSRTGFSKTAYGESGGFSRPSPIDLRANQVFDAANVALTRDGVITGQITDANGAPMVDVRVTAGRAGPTQTGRFTTVRAGYTDDEGVYRIWGLAPGKYFVKASPADIDVQSTSAGLVAAVTYYPGVPVVSMAQPVEVRAGGETNVSLAIKEVGLSEISGRVLDAAGRPAAGARGLVVRLDEGGARTGGELFSVAPVTGAFRITRLPPADYELVALLQTADRPAEAGVLSFTASGGTLEAVTITTTRLARIRGRVTSADGRVALPAVALTVTAPPVAPRDADLTVVRDIAGRAGAVSADGTFELPVLPGRRLLAVSGLPRGWAIAGIAAGDRDITASPVDLPPGSELSGVTVALTNELSSVTGQAVAADGGAAAGAIVLVFPAARSRWRAGAGFIYVARANQEGRFAASGLVAGEYFVIALEEFEPQILADPAVLESLAPRARTVRLDATRPSAVEPPLLVVKQ